MSRERNPPLIVKGPLNGRFYFIRSYKLLEDGKLFLTGQKIDVTESVRYHFNEEIKKISLCDEVIEATAKSLYEASVGLVWPTEATDTDLVDFREDARIAITAALSVMQGAAA